MFASVVFLLCPVHTWCSFFVQFTRGVSSLSSSHLVFLLCPVHTWYFFFVQFTQAIGLERFHLVGESMGAHISLLLTAKYEDKIKTLTAMCPPVDEAKRSKFFLTLETTGRNLILADNVTEFQQMLALVQHVPPKIMPQRVLKAMVDIQKERKKGYEDVFLQLMLSRESPEMYYEKLSHLRLPVFLIWGEDDRVCDISGGRILTKIISHAEMKVVERCGHALSIERPRKTSHLINAFIQKHVQ
jgi:pimeloyl-ACP methyl ester carboxylesterase